MSKKDGFSLTALILMIVIFVIIAIVILSKAIFAINNAQMAKFNSEISDYGIVMRKEYNNRNAKYSLMNNKKTNYEIYYEIASGKDSDLEGPKENGKVSELPLNIMSERKLTGTYYYEVVDDTVLSEYSNQKVFYSENETHYVTDAGDVFVVPGFPDKEDEITKYWINENVYYIADEI